MGTTTRQIEAMPTLIRPKRNRVEASHQLIADAAKGLVNDWERLATFYRFPQSHWRHLRMSNPAELTKRDGSDPKPGN
jgi:hypothetical protein